MDRQSVALVAVIVLLMFLFYGTPDVFDKLLALTMRWIDGQCR